MDSTVAKPASRSRSMSPGLMPAAERVSTDLQVFPDSAMARKSSEKKFFKSRSSKFEVVVDVDFWDQLGR